MYFPQVRSPPRRSDRFNPPTLMIGAKRRTSSKANPPGALMFHWSLIQTLPCQLALTSKEKRTKVSEDEERGILARRQLSCHPLFNTSSNMGFKIHSEVRWEKWCWLEVLSNELRVWLCSHLQAHPIWFLNRILMTDRPASDEIWSVCYNWELWRDLMSCISLSNHEKTILRGGYFIWIRTMWII